LTSKLKLQDLTGKITETDGFRNSKGGNVILELTPSSNITPGSYGADTLEEMTNDMEIIGVDLSTLLLEIAE